MFDNDLYKMLSGTVVRWLLTASFGFFLSQGWVTTADEASYTKLVGGIIAGAFALGWSFYQKYGHARVKVALAQATGAAPGYNSKGSVGAIKPLVLFAFIVLALAFSVPRPADAQGVIVGKSPPINACVTTHCTGWYVGGGFAGNGTNADILGSGLSGSVFAGGAIPFVNAGYQYWNGKLFLAFEAGIGDQINTGGVINNEGGLFAYEEAQFGGTLYGLFNADTAPITVPTGLTADLIAPYIAMGMVERSFANGFETGAGAKFSIAPNLFLDVGYRYINYGSATVGVSNGAAATFNAENLVRVSVNYKF